MNICQYCDKSFKSERTLAAHMCVKKKRKLEQDTIGARLGFRVFQRFYELTTKSKTPKTVDDFVMSRYYMAFVKFARYVVGLNPIDTNAYVDYVIQNGFDIDDWCTDRVYFQFLKKHIEEEHLERAMERSLIEMERWCKDNNCNLEDYFTKIGTIEATFVVRSGRISPWILYLSEPANKLLDQMSEEQIKMIEGVIDPSIWREKFVKNKEDVKFVKSLLKEYNI